MENLSPAQVFLLWQLAVRVISHAAYTPRRPKHFFHESNGAQKSFLDRTAARTCGGFPTICERRVRARNISLARRAAGGLTALLATVQSASRVTGLQPAEY